MRLCVCCSCLVLALILSGPAGAQKLDLRGDRFPGLTYEEMTPEQKAITDRALAGRGPIGTFNILLRSPELSESMRGTAGPRANSAISAKQSELAILMNARLWTTQFEWYVHHRAAVQVGLDETKITALIEGRRPENMLPDEGVVYNFLQQLQTAKRVSDAAFEAAREKLTEKGIVDLIGVVGFYGVTSMLMNADRYPMPPGQKPELMPLAQPLPLPSTPVEESEPAPVRVVQVRQGLELRGGRFAPLTYEEMNPAQKAFTDRAMSGKIEGGAGAPFNVLLRSPELGEPVMRYGAHVRFHSPVPDKLKELAILITARYWGAQFQWQAHHRAGAQAGLSEAVIVAIGDGKKPTGLPPDEQIVYNFATELFRTTQIGDATFNAAKQRLGERGLVELMGLIGYYQIISMIADIDRYPLPNGARPELRPMANPIP